MGPTECEQNYDKNEDKQIDGTVKNEMEEKPQKEIKKNDQILPISSSSLPSPTKSTTELNKFATILVKKLISKKESKN